MLQYTTEGMSQLRSKPWTFRPTKSQATITVETPKLPCNFWTIRQNVFPQIWPRCFITESTLAVNNIWHASFSKKCKRLFWTPNWSLHQTETETTYFGKRISDFFPLLIIDREHTPPKWDLEQPNTPNHIPSALSTIYTKIMKPKTKCMRTVCVNERKWWQPQFQLHLVTKSRSRWELG